MSRQPLFLGQPIRPAAWHYPAALAALAGLTVLGGGWALVDHLRQPLPGSCRAAAGLTLLFVGLAQFRIVQRVWQSRKDANPLRLYNYPLFWRWMLTGPIVSYLLCLTLGPRPGVVFAYIAGLGVWFTVALAAHDVSRAGRERAAGWLHSRLALRVGWTGFLVLIALSLAESGVRLGAWALGRRLPETFVVHGLRYAPGHTVAGRPMNAQGYWDQPFEPAPRPGVLRVAALGDGLAMSGDAQTNFLEQIERRVPGVEVYNFGVPHAGPQEYAVQLADEVIAYQPDLVLTFVSIGNDITEEQPLPDTFDWQSLRLVQLGGPDHQNAAADPSVDSCATREDYLRLAAARLEVCRTPIAAPTEVHWESTFAHLETIAQTCRNSGIAVAFVLAPAEYQIDAEVCAAARRHAGCEPGQLDLALPQRRLAAFAAERQIPLLDLLPHLRAAPRYPYELNSDRWNDSGNEVVSETLSGWLQHRWLATLADGR